MVTDLIVKLLLEHPEAIPALEAIHLWKTPAVAVLAGVFLASLWFYAEANR